MKTVIFPIFHFQRFGKYQLGGSDAMQVKYSLPPIWSMLLVS